MKNIPISDSKLLIRIPSSDGHFINYPIVLTLIITMINTYYGTYLSLFLILLTAECISYKL